ncbi:MAG: hypothetical protein WCN95_09150 [bacterium]
MNQNEMSAFKRAAGKMKGAPVTVRDKVVGVVIGLVFIALCAGILLNPDLVSENATSISGSGGQLMLRVIDIIWSRPTGAISGIIGLFVGWGSITRKTG